MNIRLLLIMCLAIILISCGESPDTASSSSSSSSSSGEAPVKSIQISANIYNPGPGKPIKAASDYSTIEADADPVRLPDVSIGNFIEVSWSVTNDGEVALENLRWETQVEDSAFITSEYWQCWQCFPYGSSGTGCNGLWRVEGGTIIAPQEAPTLPACEGNATSGFCVDPTPPEVDCDSPWWEISYQPPGDGLRKATGIIQSLGIGNTTGGASGFTSHEIRDGRLARIIVNGSGIERTKSYIFNGIP